MMDESWMLPREAIDFVTENVEAESVVVEFGSGHGSELLAKHCKLYSIEHDKEWLGISSSTYIYAPITKNQRSSGYQEIGWYDVSIVESNWPKTPAMVLIDGPPGHVGRHGILAVLHLLENVSIILVDDVDRDAEQNLANVLCELLDMNQTIHSVDKPRKNGGERKFAVLIKGE